MSQDVTSKIDGFFSKYPQRAYPKGQILIFANENPEYIFYITEGRVRKYDISYRGDEVVVNIFKPPAFFPMSWALNHLPNKFFYKTETKTILHVVPCDDALRFLKDNPDVMLDLLSRIYRGMDGLFGRLVHLMSGSARSRLLYELIIECRRFGEKQSDGKVTLDISEVDMAARSGLSRETVSREIHKLKTVDLVSVSSKGIVVNDLKRLEKSLGLEI